MSTKWWWKDPDWWDHAFYLMARSAAQGLLLAIGTDAVGWFDHWYQILGSTVTYVLLSFLTSILMSPSRSLTKPDPK